MRNPVQMKRALAHIVFQAMVAHFSLSPVINLLATPLNSQLPVFSGPSSIQRQHTVSRMGLVQDAVCFSPTALVCDVLMKPQSDSDFDSPMVAESVVVPDLLEFSIDHPLELVVTQTPLTQ